MRCWRLLGTLMAVAGMADAAPAPPPAPWLAQVAARPTPLLPGEVPAYALFAETVMTISPIGVMTERQRYAVRVLTQRGDALAVASIPYTETVDKLVSGTAWLVRDGKTAKSEPLKRWIDICLISDGTVFTEERNRMISFPRETLGGDVFGYETVAERPMLIPQHSVEFSEGVPLGTERFEVVLPPGWRLDYLARGEGVPAPVVDPARNSWSWELRDRPYIPSEEWTTRVSTHSPRLFLTFTPPADAKGIKFARMQSWAEVGGWIEELGAGQCDRNPALVETSQRLAAGSADRLALLREFCAHVQRLRYVAVNRGLGLGFGYKPRKATEVLARGYGDCKDKANLLRAMLREVGINAYLVSIESGRRHPTVVEWPSVAQFNHAINAIEVDASVDLPAVVPTADGRRLLLFDPTDEYTVLGDLPWYLQGATGLVLQGTGSFLVEVPELPHDVEWRYGTEARLAVAADGQATGHVAFTFRRQAGRGVRAALRNLTPRELSELSARYMNSLLRGVAVREPRFIDDPVTGDVTYSFALDAQGVFQPGPGGIFLMRLDVFNRDSVPQLGTNERVQPVEIRPIVHDEVVTFDIPDGFIVDDAPNDVREEGAYGMYERTVEVTDRTIRLRRKLQFSPQIVPASSYPQVRAFLTAAARADKVAVVLRRER